MLINYVIGGAAQSPPKTIHAQYGAHFLALSDVSTSFYCQILVFQNKNCSEKAFPTTNQNYSK